MTKKKFILAALVFAVLSITACGGSQSGGSQSAGQPQANASASGSGQKKTLDFMWFSDGVEGDVLKSIISDYESQNPDIKINVLEVPFNDLENKLRMSVAGGEPPALARTAKVNNLLEVIVDLGEYLDADSFKDQFLDSLDNYYIYDGKVVAAPIDVTANGLIYNKTAFDKAGVSVPTGNGDIWTVDEWKAAMKQVMEKGDVRYGLVIDRTPHRWSTLLYGQGGSILSEDGKNCVVNNDAGISTMNLMKDLHDENIAPKSVWVGSEDPNNLFRSGQVGMHLAGSWMMTNYRDNIQDFEWGVTYLPIGERRSSVVGGKQIVAFKNTGLEKEAVDFIQYFTSQEVNAKYCVESLFLSPRKDNAALDYPFAKEYFEVFADELANTPAITSVDWTSNYFQGDLQTKLREGIADVVGGNKDAKAMLDEVQAAVQEALK